MSHLGILISWWVSCQTYHATANSWDPWLLYSETTWSYMQLFCHNTLALQTDTQTDNILRLLSRYFARAMQAGWWDLTCCKDTWILSDWYWRYTAPSASDCIHHSVTDVHTHTGGESVLIIMINVLLSRTWGSKTKTNSQHINTYNVLISVIWTQLHTCIYKAVMMKTWDRRLTVGTSTA